MSGQESQRNLVLVSVDSLRADHCGFVNSASELTPTIDQLANDGISFPETVAPGPRTPSSVPVLFTGEFLEPDDSWTMADWQGRQQRIGRHMRRFRHLSEQLQRRGYETAAFTANPWTTRESNFDIGFDEFSEISATSEDVSSRHLSDSTLFKLADTGFESLPIDPVNWSGKKEWFSQWTGYFDLIEQQLSSLTEPFFLWIFILDTHQPYITPRRFREESSAWQMYYSILRYWHGKGSDEEIPDHAREMISETYRDAVRSVDAFVESVTDSLAPFDPITVFHSDHGEALGEHDAFGHEQTLYEENLRVPFFIHNADATRTITDQVSLRSLPDLLVDVTNPDRFDPETYTQPFAISKIENNQKTAIRTSRWKFITGGDDQRLYDLRTDPEETSDVSSQYEDVVAACNRLYQTHEATQSEKAHIKSTVTDLLQRETV